MVTSRVQENAGIPPIGASGDINPTYRYLTVWIPHGNAMAANYASMGGGAMAMGEVATSGVGGLVLGATTDDCAFPMYLPDDVDVERAISVSVIWSSDQTTIADDFVWAVNYKEFTLNTTAIAVPATAIGTQIASDPNSVTANAIQQTAWGTITASTFTGTGPDGYFHLFEIDPTTAEGTLSSDTVVVWAVIFRYFPRKL